MVSHLSGHEQTLEKEYRKEMTYWQADCGFSILGELFKICSALKHSEIGCLIITGVFLIPFCLIYIRFLLHPLSIHSSCVHLFVNHLSYKKSIGLDDFCLLLPINLEYQ